ncbi:MAG: PAS domain S-box protein, partial [Burkholderiales bacterium]|nr:PAS domain S-box protein [Burkholderiales bacterium]
MTGEGPGSEVDTGADRAGARPDLRVLQAGPEAEIFRLARAALAHRYAVVHRAVADEAELRAALRAGEWDVLLCDPRAEGADCKALFGELGESASEVVAIAVSEREEEPLAAELISLGARAVLGRARLGRLAPIVARELENLRRRRLKELRALLDTSPDPMLIADADGRIRYASRRLEALLGYLPDELTGKPVETLVPEHLRAQHTVERARYARGPVPWPLGAGGELVALHKDGTPIPVEISLGPLRLGGETFVCCGLRDLRERRRAERLLRAILEGTAAATGEEFLRALVRNLAQALEVRFAFVSVLEPSAPGRARVLAFWNGDAYLAPHEYPLASSPCETVLAQGELLVRDGLGARFGGESRLRDLGAQGFFGVRLAAASGEPLGVLAIADLAPLGEVDTARTVLRIFAARAAAELERARIAAQLAARERWFRDMAELSSDWYWEQDENFRFVPLTQTDSGGHAPWLDWVVGKTRWEVASEGLSEEQWAEHRRKLEAHEEFRDFEYPARPPGGQPRWMSVSGRPVYDADGRFRGYRGVARDVTARRAMEQALRESEARFREIFRAAPDMMTLVRRRDGTYLDVNPAFEEFTGYRRDEALGR